MGWGLLGRADMKREQTGLNPLPPSPDSWKPLPPSPDSFKPLPPSPDSWNPLPPSPHSSNQVPNSPPKDHPFKGSSKDPSSKSSSNDPTLKSDEPTKWQIINRIVVSLGLGVIPWILWFMALYAMGKCKNKEPW